MMNYFTASAWAIILCQLAPSSFATTTEPLPTGLFTDAALLSAPLLPEPIITTEASALGDGAAKDSRYDPTMLVYSVAGFEGESIDPRSLQVSWEQTDLVVPGNAGLDIRVSRSHNKTAFAYQQIGDWVLGIPRLQIPTAPIYLASTAYYSERPWLAYWQEIIGDTGAAGLCDAAPYLVPENNGDGTVYAAPWVINIPGEGQKVLMERDRSATPGAFPASAAFVTADNWYAECIAPPDSPESWGSVAWGGFRLVSPQGTRYDFDVIYSVIPGETGQGTFGGWLNLTPSSVEDIHGNRLEYEYFTSLYNQYGYVASQLLYRIVGYDPDGNLDGRAVQFSYDPYFGYDAYRFQNHFGWKHSLATVWVADPENPGAPNPNDLRRVNYIAEADVFGNILKRVDQPEGLSWHFSSDIAGTRVLLPNSSPSSPMVALASVTFPTGGSVSYAYVPGDRTPSVRRPARLLSRTTFGDDAVTGVWGYSYSLAGHMETTSIADPSGALQQYSFYEGLDTYVTKLLKEYAAGRNYGSPLANGKFMGRMLQHRFYSPTATLLRTEDLSWDSRATIGLLAYGYQNYSYYNFDTVGYFNAQPPVVTQTTVTNHETGAVFSTAMADINIYGQPLRIAETGVDGSIASPVTRTTLYDYFNQLAPWVNGLVTREVITGSGEVRREYNAKGLLTELDRSGIHESYTYYPTGELWQRQWVRDGLLHEHRYANYKRGIAQNEILPDYSRLSRRVLDSGLVAEETDPLGNSHGYSFDGMGRLLQVQYPGTDTLPLQLSYDPINSRHAAVSRGPYRQDFYTDGFGRLLRTESSDANFPADSRIQLANYDASGRRVWQSYPAVSLQAAASGGVSYQYDSLSRITQRTEPLANAVERYFYSNNDSVATEYSEPLINGVITLDSRGYATAREYRSFGNPERSYLMMISRQKSLAADSGLAEFVTATYTRNILGQLTSSRQGDVVRRYSYDERNLLNSENGPEAAPLHYEYDAIGNVLSVQQGHRETSFVYDRMNRQVNIDYFGSTPDARFSYYPDGSISTARRGDAEWAYTYSPTGKVSSESLQVDGQGFDLAYSYSAADSLAAVTYPSGNTVAFAPDAYGQPRQVGAYLESVGYHPNGDYLDLVYANGLSVQRTTNAAGRIESFAVREGIDALLVQDYDYDYSANLTRLDVSGMYANAAHEMAYDGLGRLVNASGFGPGTGAYRYDDNDNLTFKDVSAPLNIAYDVATNRVLAAGDALYSYDLFGNTLSQGQHNFNYDAVNQVASVASLPGTTYSYDAFNRRAFSTVNGERIYTGFSRDGLLMFRANGTAGQTTEYAYLQRTLVGSFETTSGVSGPADTDGDLIPDHIEIRTGTDPVSADGGQDADADGLTNLEEFLQASLANDSDTDDDGMSDGYEYLYGFRLRDPTDALDDADNDGLTNATEFSLGTNPLLADTDGDGLSDSEDGQPLSAPPLETSPTGSTLPLLLILLEE